MTRGRHSRPRARGGGLASLLAIALAGGAVAVGLGSPSTATLRLCVIAGAAVGAIGLLLVARMQRVSSRALARTEDRLRVLEQRSRDEGEDLHRRVIEAVTREGELRIAVDVLALEIARLRASLDGLAVPVATMAERTLVPYMTPTYDLPLVQAAFAEPVLAAEAASDQSEAIRVDLAAATAAALGTSVEPLVEQLAEVAEPPAGELWQPPQRPEPVPVLETSSQVRSWVVRELDVSDDDEPVAALTMRILDLRAPVRLDADDIEDEPETAAVGAGWTSFARPA